MLCLEAFPAFLDFGLRFAQRLARGERTAGFYRRPDDCPDRRRYRRGLAEVLLAVPLAESRASDTCTGSPVGSFDSGLAQAEQDRKRRAPSLRFQSDGQDWKPMIRAVFLDKDGTLVEDDPLSAETTRVRFFPDVFAGLRLLHRAGYALIVVTNQGGVAQGRITDEDVHRRKAYLQSRLAEVGIPLDGFYYCPHHPEGIVKPYATHCLCRKPQPGLLVRASSELGVDVSQSWMVGDILHDVEAGRWAGCRTVLLNNGHETEWHLTEHRWPHYIADTLLEAAQLIALSGLPRPEQAVWRTPEEER